MRGGRHGAAALAAFIGGLLAFAPAAAQTPSPDGDAISTNVTVQPQSAAPDDPHNGTWFVVTARPGHPTPVDANIINPLEEPAEVDLYIRDLVVDEAGRTTIEEDPTEQAGVGSWVEIEPQRGVEWDAAGRAATLEVGRAQTRGVEFVVTVPSGTRAGDYVGVVIAETLSRGPDVDVRQRHATRIYVTVPGIADTAFDIVDVETTLDSQWWPSAATVVVTLSNDGAIRIAPNVTVGGVRAEGPRLVLKDTQEQYIARVDVSPLSGALNLPVDAEARGSGEARTTIARGSLLPWRLVVVAAIIGVGVFFVARRLRRFTRLGQLETDFQRLERLITVVRQEVAGEIGAVGATTALAYDDEAEPAHALHIALKRARRTQSYDSLARVALAMHARDVGDPLPILVEALQHETDHQAELLVAASTYDPDRVGQLALSAHLPPEVADQLRGAGRLELPALDAASTIVLPAHRATAGATTLVGVGAGSTGELELSSVGRATRAGAPGRDDVPTAIGRTPRPSASARAAAAATTPTPPVSKASSRKVSTTTSAKTPAKAATKSTTKTAAKAPARTTAKTAAKTAAKTTTKAPTKTATKTAAKTPVKAPSKSATKTPAKTVATTSRTTTSKTPATTTAKSPAPNTSKAPKTAAATRSAGRKAPTVSGSGSSNGRRTGSVTSADGAPPAASRSTRQTRATTAGTGGARKAP